MDWGKTTNENLDRGNIIGRTNKQAGKREGGWRKRLRRGSSEAAGLFTRGSLFVSELAKAVKSGRISGTAANPERGWSTSSVAGKANM